MIAAMALQSSTAVAILTAGFVASGGIAISAGLAILLGADLGSALVAKLLLARQAWFIPILLLGGVVLFLRAHQRRARQSGRILIGLALIFVSLDMLRPLPTLFRTWEEGTASAILDAQENLRKRHFGTKLYLVQLTRNGLSEELSQSSLDLSTTAANFEAAGDAIASTLLSLAQRLTVEGVHFFRPGWQEICDFHDRVLANA